MASKLLVEEHVYKVLGYCTVCHTGISCCEDGTRLYGGPAHVDCAVREHEEACDDY